MFRKYILYTVLAVLCGRGAAAEETVWASPHPLHMEQVTPAPLLPYPKHWAPQEEGVHECGQMPGRSEWALEGDRTGGAMVQTAWEGLLASLPGAPAGRRVVCRLTLDAEALLAEGRKYGQHAERLEERLAEGYAMHTSPEEVQIIAASEAGLFYGLQTLRQLVCGQSNALPKGCIIDYPAFPVRGFHQDCGRNFQSIESLKRQIDIAARLKLNYFHWHLSDYPAFHLQSKKYPQLNAPEYRTRDKADTYTYDQVRELIAYAKARHVTIIPEIDMPGHSDYFERAFGFEMYTEQGMRVLEDVLDELCAEIPAEDCPIIHIGADEVRVPNAEEFVARMSRKICSEHGRRIMQWEGPWDLPVGPFSIAQRWVQGKASLAADSIRQRTIDSSIGYSNLMDPALLVRRWFFMQPCGVPKGDELRRGAIFCTWPDRRVEDKSRIPLQSPQWPGMCAMAERAWVGGSNVAADAFPTNMPAPDTEAARAFSAFERRMLKLRHTVFAGEPFPYWEEGARENLLVGPVPMEQVETVRAKVLAGDLEGLPVRQVWGGSLYFRTAPGGWNLGMFSQVQPGHCVWVITRIAAREEGPAPFMLGFDAPLRSHQYYTGIPRPGEWSACGTRIWLNGAELRNPRSPSLPPRDWKTMVDNAELPLLDEEIWWTHPPTLFPLRQGENTFIIEQPYMSRIQSWSISLIPCS